MYGKFFASTFTGSMFGAGPDVFALWGYVIAHTVDGTVELNPAFLSAVLGTTTERIEAAMAVLLAEDAASRSTVEGGRRLIHEGAFQYRVVNHAFYRAMRNEEDRRAYNRDAKRRERALSNRKSMTVIDMSAVSAHTEAESEAETDTEAKAKKKNDGTPPPPPRPIISGESNPKTWGKIHGEHVTGFCDWVCLPEFLFAEFARKSGNAQTDGTAYVKEWAASMRVMWEGTKIGDNLKFWRARWDESHVTKAESAKPKLRPVSEILAERERKSS